MIEALVLTGGKSARMGRDKATLPIEGEAQAVRIVRRLREAGTAATALGKRPVEGAAFLPDAPEVDSPLAALRGARTWAARGDPDALVPVLACDLPHFDAGLIAALARAIGDADAAVPVVDGFRQPMVALYRRRAFAKLPEAGCPMDWLAPLDVRWVTENELRAAGVDPASTRGANTPAELAERLGAPASGASA